MEQPTRREADPTGLDLAAVTGWIDATRPGLRRGPLTARQLTGGLSNLTYELTDGHSRWALRRPPLGHALPTAHDMEREYRILSALHGTTVPVPPPVAVCADREVLGVPFYLMGFVDGVVLDRPPVLDRVTPAQAARSGRLLMDTLLALHDLAPDAVGLGELGRPEGFLPRQLRRWTTQWQSSATRSVPELDALVAGLGSTVPAPSPAGIVHGDYRLTNVIYTPDVDRIAAVVDWEMATLGDPLTDLGLLVVYHQLSADGGFVMPRLAPDRGFAPPEELVARYAQGSDRDLGTLPWYVAFGWFKLAVIAEGIHARHLAGLTVGAGFEQIGTWVPHLLGRGLAELSGGI